MGRFRVYVYAICKNESQFVSRYMASMREADAVYVLDTGSTDDTVEKLKNEGAVVQQEIISPWRFDTARNRSLQMVPEGADICVCTDLDEVFLPGWRQKIEEAWARGAEQLRYKYVWRFTPDDKEDVVFFADKIHARRGFCWTHPVHEVLTHEGTPRKILAEGVQLNHYPDLQKSRAQYLPLLELSVQEDPLDDRNRHYLGREYLFTGQYDKCIQTLKHHLTMPTATWRDERSASLRYIACAYGEMGNRYQQERYLLRAAAEAPHLREGWLDLARFSYQEMNWPAVMYFCERALSICDRPRTYITEGASFGALPYDLLSVAAFHLGIKEKALDAVNAAIDLEPDNERLLKNKEWIEKM